jgi:hypothetical protein
MFISQVISFVPFNEIKVPPKFYPIVEYVIVIFANSGTGTVKNRLRYQYTGAEAHDNHSRLLTPCMLEPNCQ